VAEHRVDRHRILIRLTRTTTLTRIGAIACVAALALAGAPGAVAAQTSSGGISGTRRAVDAAATQWFAAQRHAAQLDLQIATVTQTLATLGPKVDRLRVDANTRAVALYESNSSALSGVPDLVGDNPLDIGRRAALIGQANSNGQAVIDALEASISDLHAQRKQLSDARAAQERTLHDLAAQRHTLDTELADLEQQAAANDAAAHAASAAAARNNEPATTAEPTRSATVALKIAPAPSVPSAPTPPPDTGQVSPHHDDPFLVCTRARESSGDYSVVSSSGYYGAYQFSPTTWNVTASHAGRLDLVGVLPSQASAYDQDEMAWTLYQWQGTGPWGGSC
jgi:septal ring factor EnvC (AmiA/AmiB activator)